MPLCNSPAQLSHQVKVRHLVKLLYGQVIKNLLCWGREVIKRMVYLVNLFYDIELHKKSDIFTILDIFYIQA